jgi:predicted lysophospholipase L1 biosynthesis ABC-type transport system permease subunit
MHDMRTAFRALRREPGHTTIVVALVALGIAATTALTQLWALCLRISCFPRSHAPRSALGASAADVITLVVKQAALIIAGGVAIGTSVAAFLSTSLSQVLYGSTPRDPVSFVAGPMLVAVVGLAACIGPVRRAVGIDPLRAVRSE